MGSDDSEDNADAELLAHLQADDDGAMRDIVARHGRWLLRAAMRKLGPLEAEDHVSEVFLRFWATRHQIRSGPHEYLRRIDGNLYAERARPAQKRGAPPLPLTDEELQLPATAAGRDHAQIEKLFTVADRILSGREKRVFELQMDGCTGERIAQVLEVSAVTVNRAKREIERKLREALE